MTRIFLIRHAEAEGNIFRRAHGHYNGLVTINGAKQIECLEKRFEGERISAVFSSDLSRTCTTATAISKPRDLQIQTSEMLREVKMGVWEDCAWGDIEHQYSGMYEKFDKDPAMWNVDGGDDYEAVKNRMSDFICEKAKLHDEETIAVFSHGFAIRSLLCKISGVPSHRTHEIPYCDNTSVALLKYENGKLSIDYHGDNSHLSEEISTFARQTWWREENQHVRQNLRFMPLNEVAGEELIRIFHAKIGDRARVDQQYAAFHVDYPVGIVGLDTKKDKHRGIGWLRYLHVIPPKRDMSYGTQLLGMAISDFRKLRRERLRAELPSGSLGINFMSKYGFNTLDVNDNTCLMEKNIKNW